MTALHRIDIVNNCFQDKRLCDEITQPEQKKLFFEFGV
jgi:hypothetical protein